MHWASLHARRLGAVETAVRLLYGHLLCQSLVHLLQAGRSPVFRIQFRHLHSLYGHALLGLHGLAQLCSPRCRPVGKLVSALFRRSRLARRSSACLGGSLSLRARVRLALVVPVLKLVLFHLLESGHSAQHLVPVHLVAVKLRTVDADEARLAANGETAGAAHARAVHHDGVERHVVGDVVFPCHQRRELHHHWWANGEHLVHLLALYHFLNANCHHAFLSVGPVVGHYYNLVAVGPHLVFEYDELLGPSGKHRHHPVAGLVERGEYGQDGGNADAAAGAHHGAIFLYLGWRSERAHHVLHVGTLWQFAKLCRREADFLHHERERAFLRVALGYGVRHPFGVAVHTDDDEVARLAALSDERCLQL